MSIKNGRVVLGIISFNKQGVYKVHIKIIKSHINKSGGYTTHLEWLVILHALIIYNDIPHIIYTDSENYTLYKKYGIDTHVIKRTRNCAHKICSIGHTLGCKVTVVASDDFEIITINNKIVSQLEQKHMENIYNINNITKRQGKKKSKLRHRIIDILSHFKIYRIIQKHRYKSINVLKNKHVVKKLNRKSITFVTPEDSYYYQFYQMRNQYDRKLFEDKMMLRRYTKRLQTTKNTKRVKQLNDRIDIVKHRLDEKIYI
jgi:hypothetical protein